MPHTSLILGAGGQLGGDLAPALRRAGDEVHLADKAELENASAHAALSKGGVDWSRRWTQIDATDAGAVAELIQRTQPDRIFHLAATLSVVGETNPAACWHVNTNTLLAVLEAAKALVTAGKRPQVFFPSSIAAYGRGQTGYPPHAVRDDHPLFPETTYGATKVAGEALGGNYAARHGIDFRGIRFPGLLNNTPPGGGSTDYANAMYDAARRGLTTVEADVRPDTRVPFMHTADALRSILMLCAAPENRLTRRVYNVTAFAPTAAEFAEAIRRHAPKLTVRWTTPGDKQDNLDSWPDDISDQCARQDWGWAPEMDLEATTRAILSTSDTEHHALSD